MTKANQKNEYVTVDPEVRFGKPCIKETRIAVVDILNLLSAGYTMGEIIEQYPELNKKQVKGAIQFATELSEEPTRVLNKAAAKK